MPTVTYPHTFHDGTGEVASGVQVNENFNAAKTAIEGCLTLLTGNPALRLAFGSGTATWADAHHASTGNVAHGLGATPVFAIAVPVPGGSILNQALFAAVTSRDATNASYEFLFNDYVGSINPTGGTTKYVWLAIG